MDDWREGFIENRRSIGLIQQNAVTKSLESGNQKVYAEFSVNTEKDLENIPKTTLMDDMIVHVRSAPLGRSLYIYKKGLKRWCCLAQPGANVAKSIMWMGDTGAAMTGGGIGGTHPYQTAKKGYYNFSITLTNLTNGYVRSIRASGKCSTSGTGTLSFNKAARTMTWTAPGDTAGKPVDVSTPGWHRLESGSDNLELLVCLMGSSEPAADASDTISFSGQVSSLTYQNLSTLAGQFNARNGNPFGENQYHFVCTNMLLSDMVLAADQWQFIPTDITVIDSRFIGRTTIASCHLVLASLQKIIQQRQAIGSHVIVFEIPNINSASDLTVQLNAFTNHKLRAMAHALGFELIDINKYLIDPAGTVSNPMLANNQADDLSRLSHRGAYLACKYGLEPVLNKYAPKIDHLQDPLVPYTATENYGNLLSNGLFKGTAATSGNKGARFTGDLANFWQCYAGAGSVLTIVGLMPESGGAIARTDGQPGNWARFTISNAGGVENEVMYLQQYTAISSANYVVGDVIQLSGTCRIQSTAGLNGLNAYISTGVGNCYAIHCNQADNAFYDTAGDTITYEIASLPFEIPAGIVALNVIFSVYLAAGGNAIFDIAPNLCLRKLI